MKTDQFKGYFFAFLATVSFSSVYVFSKAAMNIIAPGTPSGDGLTSQAAIFVRFLFFQFLIAFILNLMWSAYKGKLALLRSSDRNQIRILLLLGLMEILTNTSFYASILDITDPAVTSFLGNLYPVILTIMGVAFLKERFTWIEATGVILALIGAFIVSLRAEEFPSTLKNMFIPGTLIVLVNALLAATTSIVGKINVKKLTPEIITLNQTFWVLMFAGILMLVFRQPMHVPAKALLNIGTGAFLGPFLGVLLVYYSFKFIEASRSSIVQSLKGIVVMGIAWIYLGTLPQSHQIWGGILTVAGVLVMTLAQAKPMKAQS